MSRITQSDIIIELVDLAVYLLQTLKQQLMYYRVSVYKQESSKQILERIEQLRSLALWIGDPWIVEPFNDFDATSNGNGFQLPHGECSFSTKVSNLLSALDVLIRDRYLGVTPELLIAPEKVDIKKTVEEHRSELLAMCRVGSRPWSFFNTF